MNAWLIAGCLCGGSPDADAIAALALARAARERTSATVKTVPAAKPVRFTNGFNCTASFCGVNGGAGCPSCPNGNGTCACGPKSSTAENKGISTVVAQNPLQFNARQPMSSTAENKGISTVVAQNPLQFNPRQPMSSTCPSGNCPQSAGYTPLFRFRR